MFDFIEEIHSLYLDLKLDKAACRSCIKNWSYVRRWNDEKSRLRKALGPDYTSKKVSTAKVALNLFALYSQVNS